MTKFAPPSFDISSQFLYDNKFWFGGMYRPGDAVGALLGYQINNQVVIGYSYDYSISELQSINRGSQEIFISYDFVFKQEKVVVAEANAVIVVEKHRRCEDFAVD